MGQDKMTSYENAEAQREKRMADFEALLRGGSQKIENCLRTLEQEHAKAREKLKMASDSFEKHVASSEMRLGEVEKTFRSLRETDDSNEGGLGPAIEDLDRRLDSLRDETRLARTLSENSFREQLRLEQSTRDAQQALLKMQIESEQKARQVHQESYMEILAQEKCTRESECQNFEQRLKMFESSIRCISDPQQMLKVDAFQRDPSLASAPLLSRGSSMTCLPPTTPPVPAASGSIVSTVSTMISPPPTSGSITALIDRQCRSVTPARVIPPQRLQASPQPLSQPSFGSVSPQRPQSRSPLFAARVLDVSPSVCLGTSLSFSELQKKG